VAEPGTSGEGWLETPQAREPQGCDRLTHRASPPGGVLRGGVSHDIASAEGVDHARDTAEVSSDVPPGQGMVGPNPLR
jgi:hypothetical protein